MELNLTIDEINIILQGLYELPARISYDLIGNIRRQAEIKLNQKATQQESN